MPTSLLIIPVFATLVGGLFAVRFRAWKHILLAVGAGLLLGAAFLDLLPEALLVGSVASVTAASLLGMTLLSFLAFFVIENVLDSLSVGENALVPRHSIGRIAGGLLVFHSFRDGMAIGAAFSASRPAGYAVAAGIAAHDLGDGMNTVLLTTGGNKPGLVDYLFLACDALAPLAGGLVALRWFSNPASSAVLMALAAGFFLQMAASDFLPVVRRSSAPRKYVVASVMSGAALIYVANLLLGNLR